MAATDKEELFLLQDWDGNASRVQTSFRADLTVFCFPYYGWPAVRASVSDYISMHVHVKLITRPATCSVVPLEPGVKHLSGVMSPKKLYIMARGA